MPGMKYTVLHLLALALAATMVASRIDKITKDSYVYYFENETLWPTQRTFAQSQAECEKLGGRLPEITSKGEYHDLLEVMREKKYKGRPQHRRTWLGLTDKKQEGTFVWQTSLKVPLWTNWNYKEPNNAGHKGEDCVEMQYSGSWNDIPCNERRPFICQVPA